MFNCLIQFSVPWQITVFMGLFDIIIFLNYWIHNDNGKFFFDLLLFINKNFILNFFSFKLTSMNTVSLINFTLVSIRRIILFVGRLLFCKQLIFNNGVLIINIQFIFFSNSQWFIISIIIFILRKLCRYYFIRIFFWNGIWVNC